MPTQKRSQKPSGKRGEKRSNISQRKKAEERTKTAQRQKAKERSNIKRGQRAEQRPNTNRRSNVEQYPKSTATKRLSEIRERRIRGKRMIIGISFVVVAFAIVIGAQMFKKYNTLKTLEEQESKLTQKYKQELQISEELKDQEAYVKTDEYVEEMARKLGLLYPNEVIFKPENSK